MTTHTVLSQRRLNRATLARQLLLEPADLDVVTALEHIGGLQAQEPASPFIGPPVSCMSPATNAVGR